MIAGYLLKKFLFMPTKGSKESNVTKNGQDHRPKIIIIIIIIITRKRKLCVMGTSISGPQDGVTLLTSNGN